MAIVVVGGSGKDVGKTALVCGLIAALREFTWTAVKITGHDYKPVGPSASATDFPDRTIWEETRAGVETDTERYLAAGARRALLVTRGDEELPLDAIGRALGDDRNVIFESNRIVDALKPDVCLALVGGAATDRKASFRRLLSVADAVVNVGEGVSDMPVRIPMFRLKSADRLPAELVEWLRERLSGLVHDR